MSPNGTRVAFTRASVDDQRTNSETSIWVSATHGKEAPIRMTNGKHRGTVAGGGANIAPTRTSCSEVRMSEQKDSVNNLNPLNIETRLDPKGTLDSVATTAVLAKELGSIGPYRLVRKLGETGMGQVWLAEQVVPVKRHVAIKVIKAGRFDSAALQRFDLERQSLAIMDHPAIANRRVLPPGQIVFSRMLQNGY